VARDTTRRLILMRHAKSDWPDVPDRDRPLAKRGRRDAPRIGRWLHEHGYQPDVVVCSAARRTRQTWDLMAPELGGSPAVRFEPRAYDASALTLLYLVQELPSRYWTALLIAHNPGLSELASSLVAAPETGPGRDRAAGNGPRPGIGLPTAGVAVLEFAGDWPVLAPGQGRLLDRVVPAGL
jgi:phosphohistidine phosphatase